MTDFLMFEKSSPTVSVQSHANLKLNLSILRISNVTSLVIFGTGVGHWMTYLQQQQNEANAVDNDG